jgi:hypothetical protein
MIEAIRKDINDVSYRIRYYDRSSRETTEFVITPIVVACFTKDPVLICWNFDDYCLYGLSIDCIKSIDPLPRQEFPLQAAFGAALFEARGAPAKTTRAIMAGMEAALVDYDRMIKALK